MAAQLIQPAARGSQRSAVLRLGLPAVGEQLLTMLVGLVDTYVVGHLALAAVAELGYGREVALASVGIANHVAWMLMTMFMAVAVGCTVVVARFVGAGDAKLANRALGQAMLVGLLMGAISLAVSYALAPALLGWLGAAAEVQAHGVEFLRISSLAFPLTAILYVGNAALRGAGNTRTPLLAMLLVNGLNALISILLVNGELGLPVLGIQGAAWASTIGRSAGGLLVIGLLLRGTSGLRLRSIPLPDRDLLWRILRMGLPFAGEQFIFQGALLIFVRLITNLGTVAYAAHTTVITVESISFLPGFGFAVAATTLVGQELGARRPDVAVESGYESFRMAAILMGAIGLGFTLAPELFLRFFIDDEAVVQAAALPLRMVGLAQPALAANFVFSGALRGGGDAKWPLYMKILSTWGLRLPVAWALVSLAGWGLNGIWLAMISDFFLQGLLAWWRFRQGRWRTLKV